MGIGQGQSGQGLMTGADQALLTMEMPKMGRLVRMMRGAGSSR